MQARLQDQAPQLEAPISRDLEALFLDGAIRAAEPAYNVAFANEEWQLQAGAVHGLPKVQGNETIELALYPFDAAQEVLRDRTKSVGKAKVRGVKPTESTLDISGVSGLSQDMTFKAVITSLPMPAIAVRLEGESEGVKLVESADAQGRTGRERIALHPRGPGRASPPNSGFGPRMASTSSPARPTTGPWSTRSMGSLRPLPGRPSSGSNAWPAGP